MYSAGLCSIVTNLEFLERIFFRVSNIKFHVKSTSGSLVDTCRWTNGRTNGYLKANRRICRLYEGICKSYVVVHPVSVVQCTISKYVHTHSEFSVSSNTFTQISPLFSWVSAGCIRMRIVAFFLHWWFVALKCFFLYFVNTFINRSVIINAALILYVGFWKCIVSGCWDAS